MLRKPTTIASAVRERRACVTAGASSGSLREPEREGESPHKLRDVLAITSPGSAQARLVVACRNPSCARITPNKANGRPTLGGGAAIRFWKTLRKASEPIRFSDLLGFSGRLARLPGVQQRLR